MKYFAVIDANVLVSALLKYHSIPGSLLELVFTDMITPVLNNEIESEYLSVLSRPKFHFSKEIINDIIQTFRLKGLYIDSSPINILLPDPKDVIFYEVVMEQRKQNDTWLVTGNIKHFPNKSYVVTPRQMLDIILKDIDL